MEYKRHFFLMISCPGDVIDERKIIKECVDSINSERSDDVWIESKYWMTDTISEAGTPAQESINDQIVNKSDGLIAVFNARLGTPVHDYKCGTDEEIQLMLNAKKHVSLLFNTKPQVDMSRSDCISQLESLIEYKKLQSKESFYKEFNSEESFRTLVKQEIRMWVRDVAKSSSPVENSKSINCGNVEQLPDNSPNIQKTEKPNELETDNQNENTPDSGGALDCIVYINESVSNIEKIFEELSIASDDFNRECDSFANSLNNITDIAKESKTMLIQCSKFAQSITKYSGTIDETATCFYESWSSLCNGTKALGEQYMSPEDKIIIRESVNSVEFQFEESIIEIDYIINEINQLPNFQKNITTAIKQLKKSLLSFKNNVSNAIDDCNTLNNALN